MSETRVNESGGGVVPPCVKIGVNKCGGEVMDSFLLLPLKSG